MNNYKQISIEKVLLLIALICVVVMLLGAISDNFYIIIIFGPIVIVSIIGAFSRPIYYAFMGAEYLNNGDYEKSIDKLEKAEELFKNFGLKYQYLEALYLDLAKAHYFLGHLDISKDYIKLIDESLTDRKEGKHFLSYSGKRTQEQTFGNEATALIYQGDTFAFEKIEQKYAEYK